MNKSFFSLLLLLVIFIATSMARLPTPDDWAQWGPYWTNPTDISDPEVIKAGQYAISEYDKTTTYHLEFIRVLNGTEVNLSQFPTVKIWLLHVEAKNCSQSGNADIYLAEVERHFQRCFWGMRFEDCFKYYLVFKGLWKLPAV